MPAVLEWKGVKWRDARENMLKEVERNISSGMAQLLASLLPKEEPPLWQTGPTLLILKPAEGEEAILYAPYVERGRRGPVLEVGTYVDGKVGVMVYELELLNVDLHTFNQLVRALQDMLKEVAPEKEMADAVGKWR